MKIENTLVLLLGKSDLAQSGPMGRSGVLMKANYFCKSVVMDYVRSGLLTTKDQRVLLKATITSSYADRVINTLPTTLAQRKNSFSKTAADCEPSRRALSQRLTRRHAELFKKRDRSIGCVVGNRVSGIQRVRRGYSLLSAKTLDSSMQKRLHRLGKNFCINDGNPKAAGFSVIDL